MKYERAVDGFGRFDTDIVELAAVHDLPNVLMLGFSVINTDDHHKVIGPILDIIILQPEPIAVKFKIGGAAQPSDILNPRAV